MLLAGLPVAHYFEFPPRTRYVPHAPFSWPVFLAACALAVAGIASLHRALGRRDRRDDPAAGRSVPVPASGFPWWGRAGIALVGIAWLFAWTRFPWFTALQPHTFTPLWVGYVLSVNALTRRRSGRCVMCDRPGFFLSLFPAGAAFWWLFEYLNRFVQNWYYPGAGSYGAWEYFWLATLPFSTVLPAVLGTRELLLTFPFLGTFRGVRPIAIRSPRRAACAAVFVSLFGLAGIGVWPDALFPLVWAAPPILVVSLQAFAGERHALRDAARGDWSGIAASALAALVCGVFWEMWNWRSLAKWVYAIPYVDRFHLFEMPVLGYLGYLPFGVMCAIAADLLDPGGGA